jgi:hypothetical protein
MRKYDTLAISLLIFSVVLVVAIAVDPKGFQLHKWQPLMSAILTLTGAGIVFQGAKLAYQAAMAKVQYDQERDRDALKRKSLGLLLRFDHTLHVLQHEADDHESNLEKGTDFRSLNENIEHMEVSPSATMEEIWSNLELFDPKMANLVSNLQIAIYNVHGARLNAKQDILDKNRNTPAIDRLKRNLREVSSRAGELKAQCIIWRPQF